MLSCHLAKLPVMSMSQTRRDSDDINCNDGPSQMIQKEVNGPVVSDTDQYREALDSNIDLQEAETIVSGSQASGSIGSGSGGAESQDLKTTIATDSDLESEAYPDDFIVEQQPRCFEDTLDQIDLALAELRREIAEEKALAAIESYKLETASDSVPDNNSTVTYAKSFIFNTPDLTRVAFCDDPNKPLELNLASIKSELFRLKAVARRYPFNASMEEIDKRIADADPLTKFWAALDERVEELARYLPSDHLPITDFYRYRPRYDHVYTTITEADQCAIIYAAQQRRQSLCLYGIPSAMMLEEMKIWDHLLSVISHYPEAIASRNLLKKLKILHLMNDLQYSLRTAILAEFDARLRVSGLESLSHF